MTPGKGSETFEAFRGELLEHGGDPGQVSVITMDMSLAFIKGAGTVFPHAAKVFDKFHIVKLFNAAIDRVRRNEQRELGKVDGKLLKNARWLLLKNKSNLTEKQRITLESLEMQAANLKTFKMLRMRSPLQEAYAESKSEKQFKPSSKP